MASDDAVQNVLGSVPGADKTGALGTGSGGPSEANTLAHEGSNPFLPKRPIVGSAALVIDVRTEGRFILLGQRGKQPNHGRWVMPGGKIEHGESIASAAEREVLEETGLEVEVTDRLGIFEILQPPEHSVFVLSAAKVTGGTLQAGDDLMAVQWVNEYQLPFTDLSWPCRSALREIGWDA